MKAKYKVGSIVYIVANQIFVKKAKIINVSASTGMYTLKFVEEPGSTLTSQRAGYTQQKKRRKHVANIHLVRNKFYNGKYR